MPRIASFLATSSPTPLSSVISVESVTFISVAILFTGELEPDARAEVDWCQ